MDAVPGWVDTLNTWTEIGSNLAQVVALLVGAWWAYTRFIRQREEWPRATLHHHIQHFDLKDGRRVLRVVERIINTGPVLLEIRKKTMRIQQILPIDAVPLASLEAGDKHEAEWLQLGQHQTNDESNPTEIEPGESDQFEHDFLIDADVLVVQVYSYFRNIERKDRELGWSMTTLYDLRSEEEEYETAQDLRSRED